MAAEKPALILFASPKCVETAALYKPYFNAAWFVQAYVDVLGKYDVITTPETMQAIRAARKLRTNASGAAWDVPDVAPTSTWHEVARGFDGQVDLASQVARRKVERVLMFMDPLDIKDYLPETFAFIRNCTLADVGLHINLGATYWAENKRRKDRRWRQAKAPTGAGKWWRDQGGKFARLLSPNEQVVHFIAHDTEKEKLARFAYHHREFLLRRSWTFSGTVGTCAAIGKYFADKLVPPWQTLPLRAAGSATTGHGPTGGDVVIADEICARWPVNEQGNNVTGKNPVRSGTLSHTVLFFIDYHHAQPHQPDIHLLLRTCLNPHRGIHLILTERTAIEWGESLRSGLLG